MGKEIVAAFAIGAEDSRVCLIRGRELLAQRSFPNDRYTPYQLFDRCTELLHRLMDKTGEPLPAALGVTLPGRVNPAAGMLLEAPVRSWKEMAPPLRGWKELEVREQLRQCTGIPVVAVERDVNACALGERHYDPQPSDDFLWLKISTGCSAAVVANGQLVRGAGLCAGSIGRLRVDYQQSAEQGSLDAACSGTAMAEMLAEACARDPELNALAGHRRRDAERLCQLAWEGDPRAADMVEKCAVKLAREIANACIWLAPERIYLGGGVMISTALFLPTLRETLSLQCGDMDIRYTELGRDAEVFGGAAIAYGAMAKQ